MGRGITKRLLDGLKDTAAGLPDKRGSSNGRKYQIADFALGAFAVIDFQYPSMLNFQESMEQRAKRNNLRSLFGVEKIPGADQIRNILDGIEPAGLYGHLTGPLRWRRRKGSWKVTGC
jgi:hypothetical protein